MKIISKFHDYYDSIAKHGQDDKIIYLRKNIEEEISNKSLPEVKQSYRSKNYSKYIENDWFFDFFYLGFCGKIYPVIRSESSLDSNKTIHFSYSLQDFEDFCKNNGIKISYKKGSFLKYMYSFLDYKHINQLRSFFSNEKMKELEKVFYEKNVPVFIYKSSTTNSKKILILNPCLKDIQFYKEKDTYTCFQDLSMFIGGVLKSSENQMITISDEDKISKHGFDKWSFRKKGPNSK